MNHFALFRSFTRYGLLMGSALCWSGCSPSKNVSVIYGDNFDRNNNVTTVTIFPYGAIKIPGQWKKTHESNISQQYFFTGPDSVTFAVALNPWDGFEFSGPQVTKENFLRSFYEWDSNYLREQTRGKVELIKEDKVANFIIWSLKKPVGRPEIFLFGVKGETAYNLYFASDVWETSKQVDLLESIYRN